MKPREQYIKSALARSGDECEQKGMSLANVNDASDQHPERRS